MHASDTTVFIAVALAILGQLGDTWTTERGLAGGLVEGNTVAKLIVNRIGVVGITLLKVIGFAQALPIVAYLMAGPLAATIVGSVAAAQGLIATVLNYRLLNKYHIK